VRRGEEDGHRACARAAEHDCVFDPHGVHHGRDVVALQLDRRAIGSTVGKPDAPHVEHDESTERGEAFEEERPVRVVPHQVDVGPDAGGVDEIDGTVAHDLIGDRGAVRGLAYRVSGTLTGRILGRMGSWRNQGVCPRLKGPSAPPIGTA
jgi:hypothetical protein